MTTDLPITLCTALALLTFARLMQRTTWPRLLAAALTLAAASVTKMSWPLMLPALAVMAVVAIFRSGPAPNQAGLAVVVDITGREATPGTVLEAAAGRLVVAAGQGAVMPQSVQPAGKKPLGIEQFLRGYRLRPGDRLGPE